MIVGVDISNYQPVTDYIVLKNNVNFVFCKASEGTGYVDPTLANNQAHLRMLDVLRGYYHFARPDLGNKPEDEADFFLSAVGDLLGGEVLALDFEVDYKGDVVAWCKAFLDHIQSKISYKPLIYLNLSLVNGNDWSSIIATGYGLWLAYYNYDPNKNDDYNTPWPTVAFRQWTDGEQVPGLPGNVDGDAFYGDEVEYIKYGYVKPVVQPPDTITIPVTQNTINVTKASNFDTVANHFDMTESEKEDPKAGDKIVALISATEGQLKISQEKANATDNVTTSPVNGSSTPTTTVPQTEPLPGTASTAVKQPIQNTQNPILKFFHLLSDILNKKLF